MQETDIVMQRQKLLLLREFFLRKTDKEHPATVEEMRNYLERLGVRADRRTIYADMEILKDAGMDIQQIRTKDVRYYLARSAFSLSELKLLVDSVQSSRFITRKKSQDLIKKLTNLTSEHNEEKLKRQVLVLQRVKSMNESIFKNIDAIQDAIALDCQCSFLYFDYLPNRKRNYYKNGNPYLVSPFSLVWNNDNYYLLAYEGKRLKHFRVDKMEKVTVLRTKTPREGKAEFDNLDMAAYTNKVFSMYSGKEQRVKLRFANFLTGAVFDRFGKDNVIAVPDGDDHFTVTVEVSVSKQFFGWLCGLGRGVVILSPDEVREEMLEHLNKIVGKYQEFFADGDGNDK